VPHLLNSCFPAFFTSFDGFISSSFPACYSSAVSVFSLSLSEIVADFPVFSSKISDNKNVIYATLCGYTYKQLTSIDLSKVRVLRFLTDYHSVRFLARETGLDNVSVSEILIALSNLLRLADENYVDEINLMSIRLKKYQGFWVVERY